MTRDEFIDALRNEKSPSQLLSTWLNSPAVPACTDAASYSQFKDAVIAKFPGAVKVVIVGSANWGYSLNPGKAFKPFDDDSDVDVAIVSSQHFEETWKEIRAYQRQTFYKLSRLERERLADIGNKVYCGFISPALAPGGAIASRFSFMRLCNELSGPLVSYKPVKAMFFKNEVEMFDYYMRGIVVARRA